MKTYFRVFINFKQNNWTRLLPIAEFVYNNAKNASTGHTFLELNYGYYLRVFYKKSINSCSKSSTIDKLAVKLKDVIFIYKKNF